MYVLFSNYYLRGKKEKKTYGHRIIFLRLTCRSLKYDYTICVVSSFILGVDSMMIWYQNVSVDISLTNLMEYFPILKHFFVYTHVLTRYIGQSNLVQNIYRTPTGQSAMLSLSKYSNAGKITKCVMSIQAIHAGIKYPRRRRKRHRGNI